MPTCLSSRELELELGRSSLMLLGVSTVVTTKIRGKKPPSYPKKDGAQGTSLRHAVSHPCSWSFSSRILLEFFCVFLFTEKTFHLCL